MTLNRTKGIRGRASAHCARHAVARRIDRHVQRDASLGNPVAVGIIGPTVRSRVAPCGIEPIQKIVGVGRARTRHRRVGVGVQAERVVVAKRHHLCRVDLAGIPIGVVQAAQSGPIPPGPAARRAKPQQATTNPLVCGPSCSLQIQSACQSSGQLDTTKPYRSNRG